MPRNLNTRVYGRPNGAGFIRLFWVRNHQPNEMLLGFYGVDGGPARVVAEFPEWRADTADRGPFKVMWADAAPTNIALDHFTCHADGSFHLKRRDGELLYSHKERHREPVGPDAGVFLDVSINTASLTAYMPSTDKPRPPHVWFASPATDSIGVKCLFAGANYPVEQRAPQIISHRRGRSAAVVLESATIKGPCS